jgi:hypothetical protein
MQFDDLEDITAELEEHLSSWHRLPDVIQNRPASGREPGVNETELRVRQRSIGNMCITTNKAHDAYYERLEALVEQERPRRSQYHQQRVEDFAAFTLAVYEQSSAQNLQKGLKNELDDFPKEVIETITIPAPQPPKSWFQRILGG